MFFKKIVGILTAFVCTGLCTMPLACSATSDPCDVNGDGVVNSIDAMAIYKHLIYNTYYTSYNQLDANQNQIVDMADYYYVLAKVQGKTVDSCFISRVGGTETPVSYPNTISDFTADGYNTVTTSREYMRYSYETHQPLSNYTLYPNSATIVSQLGDLTDNVHGIDDRIPATGSENEGIVCFPGYGTGFIVGDHVIATVAHVVYNRHAGFVTDLTIGTYNTNGTLSNTYLTPVEIHVPKAYANGSTAITDDYALVTVEEDLSDYPHFSLSSAYNVIGDITQPNNFCNVPLYTTGCPQTSEAPGGGNPNNILYTDQGTIYYYNLDNSLVLNYTMDVTDGQSGSPVYTITKQTINGVPNYTYTALAFVKSGGYSYNWGARITKYQLQFYNNNQYISY